MLGRQYTVLGLKPAVITAVDAHAVLFIDADNLAHVCHFSDDEDEPSAAPHSGVAADANEFYDEDAAEVYDECGDVRVLVPCKQYVVPPVLDADVLALFSASRSDHTSALLYTSGHFRLVMAPPDAPAHIDAGRLPADVTAEAWLVSDAALCVAAVREPQRADATVLFYALPDIAAPALTIVNPCGQRALHAMALSADDTHILCGNSSACWRMCIADGLCEHVADWDVQDLHAMACSADTLAMGVYKHGTTQPCVQIRRLRDVREVVEEWVVLDDGGLPQNSDVQLFWNARGLVVSCAGLLQVYNVEME